MSLPLQFALTFPVLFDPKPARRHPRGICVANSLYDRYLQARLQARSAVSAKKRPALALGVALQSCRPGFCFGLTDTLVDAKLQEAQGSV